MRTAWFTSRRDNYTARRFLPLALRRLITFLPVAVLIRFLNPCARFCLRLLFCAVVSDIVLLLLWYLRTGGHYKRKSKYVKQKTICKQAFDFAGYFWYIAVLERIVVNIIMKTSYVFPVDSILLLGPTGVGKSPLGDVIAENGLFNRTCHHLDFGSELRGAISRETRSAAYTHDELDFIHGVLERGLLLENEHFPLAAKIISLFLGRAGFSGGDLLVLNGIPRHTGQARDIATIATIHALIALDCSVDDVFCRIRENVGGDRRERMDDNSTLIAKKLATYGKRTAPLIEHYEQRNCQIYRISVSAVLTAAKTFQTLSALAAAYPPVTLIAEPPLR
jgi:adenylate kinase